jgi:hypothetical protein
LKNGNAEYWGNKEGIKNFLKQNRGIIAPYLERMYMNFELVEEELERKGELTTVTADDGVTHCLDPLKRKNYKYKKTLESLIVNDISSSIDFEEFGNDNSFFLYEISAEIDGIMYSSLIDKLGKIHYWNPDWGTIDPEEVKTRFMEGE